MVAGFQELSRAADDSAASTGKAAAQLGGVEAGARKAAQSMQESRDSFVQAAVAAGNTEQAANLLADEIGLIPAVADIAFRTNANETTTDLLALNVQISRVPPGKAVKIDALTDDAIKRLQDLGFTVQKLPNGQFEVTADTKKAKQGLADIVSEVGRSVGTITVDANTKPADTKIKGQVAFADGSTGTMKLDANPNPATGKIQGTVAYGNGQTATITVDGNRDPATGKINATITYANGSTGTVQVQANTSSAQAAIDRLKITTYSAHYVDVYTRDHTGGFVSNGAGGRLNAMGNLLMPMARGGLLSGRVATVVPPNTWRVIGDNMTVPEAFIPLNGSRRSLSILQEAAAMMNRSVVPFASGGIAAPTPGAITGQTLPEVRVFIGDTELTGMIRTEIVRAERATVRRARRLGGDVLMARTNLAVRPSVKNSATNWFGPSGWARIATGVHACLPRTAAFAGTTAGRRPDRPGHVHPGEVVRVVGQRPGGRRRSPRLYAAINWYTGASVYLSTSAGPGVRHQRLHDDPHRVRGRAGAGERGDDPTRTSSGLRGDTAGDRAPDRGVRLRGGGHGGARAAHATAAYYFDGDGDGAGNTGAAYAWTGTNGSSAPAPARPARCRPPRVHLRPDGDVTGLGRRGHRRLGGQPWTFAALRIATGVIVDRRPTNGRRGRVRVKAVGLAANVVRVIVFSRPAGSGALDRGPGRARWAVVGGALVRPGGRLRIPRRRAVMEYRVVRRWPARRTPPDDIVQTKIITVSGIPDVVLAEVHRLPLPEPAGAVPRVVRGGAAVEERHVLRCAGRRRPGPGDRRARRARSMSVQLITKTDGGAGRRWTRRSSATGPRCCSRRRTPSAARRCTPSSGTTPGGRSRASRAGSARCSRCRSRRRTGRLCRSSASASPGPRSSRSTPPGRSWWTRWTPGRS
jgi:hypothetical protein